MALDAQEPVCGMGVRGGGDADQHRGADQLRAIRHQRGTASAGPGGADPVGAGGAMREGLGRVSSKFTALPHWVVFVPPNMPKEQEPAYLAAANTIAKGGNGSLPHGSRPEIGGQTARRQSVPAAAGLDPGATGPGGHGRAAFDAVDADGHRARRDGGA